MKPHGNLMETSGTQNSLARCSASCLRRNITTPNEGKALAPDMQHCVISLSQSTVSVEARVPPEGQIEIKRES
jgi:hypothetical protein